MCFPDPDHFLRLGMQIRLDIPNLHVMMVLRSLCSRGYVTEKFNWQWYYYFLTNEGIDYLREVLHLPLSGFQNLELLNKTLLSFKAEGPFIRMMMFTETSLQFEMEDRWEAELGYFGDEEGSRVVQNPWIATSYMCQQICAFRTLISFYVVEVVALRTTV